MEHALFFSEVRLCSRHRRRGEGFPTPPLQLGSLRPVALPTLSLENASRVFEENVARCGPIHYPRTFSLTATAISYIKRPPYKPATPNRPSSFAGPTISQLSPLGTSFIWRLARHHRSTSPGRAAQTLSRAIICW